MTALWVDLARVVADTQRRLNAQLAAARPEESQDRLAIIPAGREAS